ncbi:MAG: lipid-A-disaccharide synthase [Chitinophagaceae bacterium]|nr:lipid-A-disaccharide synthase [Chitinophagaceae bacterium]
MRFYIIAGEASGDLHAANLVKAMSKLQPESLFRGIGGDLMKQEGVELVKHFKETAFMGFWEVFKNLRKILGFIEIAKKDILAWKPDAVILVDYPGFNLRIASFAKEKHLKVFYYISPQVWAWKASRVRKIKRDVDHLFVILPFEKEFYKKWNYEVTFVGHPLLDATEKFIHQPINLQLEKPVVALLPGSRKQEIGTILPVMLDIIPHFPDVQFVLAGVNSIDENFYREIIGNADVQLLFNQTYALLSQSKAALVTSGTATLEAALFNVPEVVCYKGGAVSFWIGKQLVDVKYISLVNLILNQPLVKELIQQEFTASNLITELSELLYDQNRRDSVLKGYELLKEKLGRSGASVNTAELILQASKLKV